MFSINHCEVIIKPSITQNQIQSLAKSLVLNMFDIRLRHIKTLTNPKRAESARPIKLVLVIHAYNSTISHERERISTLKGIDPTHPKEKPKEQFSATKSFKHKKSCVQTSLSLNAF